MTTTPQRSERQRLSVPILLAALTVIGLLLRFWHLGDWNFEATEIFTLRDSLQIRPRNPRPFSYLLNYYLVRPLIPLDEFGLRLLPALFGALTIPAVYFVTRRLVSTRAALFSALLLTFSELSIFYSQFARYWALVILLCTIYPFAIYLGIRDRSLSMLVLGLVTGVLAALSHPVSVLLLGGPMIWAAATFLRPARLRQLWLHHGYRWGAFLALVLLALIIVRFIPLLESWVNMHDKNPDSGQFLSQHKPNGVKQLFYLAGFVESLTLPVIVSAATGVYLLWQGRDRLLAQYLVALAVFPVAFLMLVSARTAISQFYFVPIVPVFFIGAGVFLDRLFDIDWKTRPQWLLPTAVVLIVLGVGLPGLLSHYKNGRRFDFRGVAEWLDRRVGPRDIVLSDQPMVLAYYLPHKLIGKLATGTPLAETLDSVEASAENRRLWLVAPAPGHSFRPNLREGGMAAWMWANCQLSNTAGVGRMDFRQQYLQIYRCPAHPPETKN